MDAEVKQSVEDLNKAFTEFKAANDANLKKSDVLLTEKVDRLNGEIDRLEKQALKMHEKALERMNTLADLGGAEKGETADVREHKAAFQSFLRKGIDGNLADLERKAMSVGSDPDGGYLVPATLDQRIIKKQYGMSAMRGIANAIQISTDALEVLSDRDEADASWVGETNSRAATTTPQLGKLRIPVHELYATPTVSQKLLDDAVVDIEGWMVEKLGAKFGRKEGAAFVAGTGIMQPRGILTYPTAATADDTRAWGTVQHIATGTSGGFGTAPNGSDKLIDAVHALNPAYHANARWLMRSTALAEVRKLRGSDGHYLYNVTILGNSFVQTLLGYPVNVDDNMTAIGADSLSIAFGDFREAYTIVDRLGTRMLRDPFTSKPNVLFYTTKRVGGDVVNFDALKLVKFGS